MSDTVPAVALLFGDTELGILLRDALNERGARIVHEGEVSTLSRDLLQQVGAEVVVVNLDDSADDALDHLYHVIDGDRPRVVFNDAQASRALTGWDRARWARHLAVKVLAAGDIDPPRPDNARGLDAPMAASAQQLAPSETAVLVDEPIVPTSDISLEEPVSVAAEAAFEPASAPDVPVHHGDQDGLAVDREQQASADSESLAAELEAMLASGDLPEEDQEQSGPGLRYFDGEEPPPLHVGNFGEAVTASEPAVESIAGIEAINLDSVEMTDAPVENPLPAVSAAEYPTDHLQLSSLTEPSVATIPATASEPATEGAAAAVQAPDNWALLDDDAEQASEPQPEQTTRLEAFGVQKMSAADFLAPDAESNSDDAEATMSLQLVSMEDAIAPQAYVHESGHEMMLDEPGSAVSRVVLLGAASGGIESACAFLAALPATTRLTFLHTQHLGDNQETALVERFAASCALPVRLARAGEKAGCGEVLVVPAGQQVRLRRDGMIEWQADGPEAALNPSIDFSLTMAANAFGHDALAIVFAGRGNDAVAGAQAIHDRGGQVWVEASSGEHFADMVSGIFAERLVSFSGTPPELAAHLIEVFP
ncbi:MAG: chemotaxis protein CheB [Pseudomonadota bacterium]|nr:chemotaxis protein CheB [Pseudomonadota bacterium]